MLFLFFTPFLVFQIPAVQNYAALKLTAFLSEELQTEVSVERVRLGVFFETRLEEFYLEDQQGDTLLYAGLLDVHHGGLYHLLHLEFGVESLVLNDAYINLSREAGKEENNLQFIVDYFAGPDDGEDDQDRPPGRPFSLKLDQVVLNNVRFFTEDAAKGETIDLAIARLEANIDLFDLNDKKIELASMHIYGPDVVLDQYERNPFPEPPPPTEAVSGQEGIGADPPPPFQFLIGDFNLTGGTFNFSNRRKEPVKLTEEGVLNFNYLDVFSINFHFRDFEFTDGLEFHGKVESSSLRERNGFVLENLSANDATLTCEGLSLLGMELKTPHTTLGDTLIFKYSNYHDWDSFPDDVRMDLKFSKEAYVSLKDIMTFAPKLENNVFFKENKNEEVNITGRFKGSVNRLNGRGLSINLANGVLLEGHFSTINLAVKDEQFLHLELDRMRTHIRTLRKLIPGFAPPENFDRLGTLDFSGNFDGFFVDFVANGRLKTDIGSGSMDVNMKLGDDLDKALYSGDLGLYDFDLGVWSGNPDFGKITARTTVKEGIGLSLNAAQAKVDGRIDSLAFKGYKYTNATLNGELKKNLFNGDLSIDDKNIQFNFGGEVNFTDTIPAFDFKTDIGRLALKKLNLSKKDIQFSGKADLKLKGKTIYDVYGDAEVFDFLVVKNQADTLSLESATVSSTLFDTGEKHFKLNSNLGNVDINGRFDIEKIPDKFIEFLHENYPRLADKLKLPEHRITSDTMLFSYAVELFELQNLVSFFDEKIHGFDETKITGSYNGYESKLALEMEIPYWSYETISFEDVYVRTKLDRNEGSVQLGVIETQLNEHRKLSPVSLIGSLYNDSLEFLIISSNFFKILDNININGVLSIDDDQSWRVNFKPSDLVLMNQKWNIDTANYIRVGEGEVETKNFQMYRNDQRIILASFRGKGLELKVRNVPLEGIDFIRNIKNHKLEGLANLDVKAKNVFKLQGLSTSFQINDLTVNGDNYGKLKLIGHANSIKEQVNTDLTVVGDSTIISLKGFLNPPGYIASSGNTINKFGKNYFDFNADIEKVPVKIVQYFVPAVLNPVGSLTGRDIHLYGPFSEPELDGRVSVNGISFKLKPLQTTYRVPEGEVVLTSNAIDATGNLVYDRFNNIAVLTGGLTHEHLRNFGLDLTVSTQPGLPFLSLETTEDDNDVFYGTALGSGFARFSGSFKQPSLYVSGKSMPGTHIFLPLTTSTVSQDNRFVRFTEEDRKKENVVLEENQAQELRGLNMEYDLSITSDAVMEVIFDKAWGDVLSGAGEGEVKVILERNGRFEIFGDVTVSRGDYLFTLMNIGLNKPFTVEPGGTVSWSGDPYNADINIDAVYKGVSAPIYSFIQEYINVTSAETQNQAKNSTPVLLYMNLTGKLLTPDIKFDIEFPSLDSELRGFAENKLRTIKRDENELNRQVFGLLVLGQFLPTGSSIQAGDVGLNTLSEMLSNQLSIYLTEFISELFTGSSIIKGIDLDLSYNRYTTDFSDPDVNPNNELRGRVKILVTDRVSFNYGTEYDTGGSLYTNGSGQWANEFEVETVLTKDHRLILNVYNVYEPDFAGGRRNKIGGRVTYRKEFDSLKELVRQREKKKKKNGELRVEN